MSQIWDDCKLILWKTTGNLVRGRKPTPTQLKVVKGTFRKDRAPAAEPQVPASMPTPPPHLSEPARGEWARVCRELYNLGVMTELDRAALGAYCQAYGRWVQAEEALARFAARDPATHGIMMKTTAGNAIQNPLVGAANKAMSDMVRFAAEFGLTPAGRARVNGGDGKKVNPAASYFT